MEQPTINTAEGEKVYLDTPKLKITSGWLCFGDTALQLENITDLQMTTIGYEVTGTNLLLVGALGAIGALLTYWQSDWAILPILGACVYGGLLLLFSHQDSYTLHVTANGTKHLVLKTYRAGEVHRVWSILMEALAPTNGNYALIVKAKNSENSQGMTRHTKGQ